MHQPRQNPCCSRLVMRRRFVALGLSLALVVPPVWAEDIVVIVHRDNLQPIDRSLVQQLYTGAVRGWPDGTPAVVLNQPDESDARAQFSATVLGRSPANVRAIWAQKIFTGQGLPPKVAPDSEMKRLVASNRNAIGYIRATLVDDSVRVLMR